MNTATRLLLLGGLITAGFAVIPGKAFDMLLDGIPANAWRALALSSGLLHAVLVLMTRKSPRSTFHTATTRVGTAPAIPVT